MEAQLVIEGIGAWRNFDDMEDCLVLDELLLMHEELAKSKRNTFRMMAAVQGIEIGDDDMSYSSDEGELPPELIAREKAWQEEKAKNAASKQFDGFGIGYARK
jgi:hypothetical protein